MDHAVARRRFLQAAAAATTGLGFARRSLLAEEPAIKTMKPAATNQAAAKRFTLGFSLYGMNTLPLEEAIKACAAIGYRDLEPALMPGYSAEPAKLSKTRRAELGRLVAGLGLGVPALMENISAVAPAEVQQANLEKIARAAELAHDLAPHAGGDAGTQRAVPVGTVSVRAVPVLETVLGGKPNEWDKLRDTIRDNLKLWAAAGEKHELTIAVKAHVGNALHTPGDLKRLIVEVGSPRIRAAYDYSHFERQGFELEESLRAVASEIVFIHVKDGKGVPADFQFLLPGEGTTDYVRYFRLLDKLQYRGSATVEVSGRIHKQPGYDAIATAKKCFGHLQAAYEASAP